MDSFKRPAIDADVGEGKAKVLVYLPPFFRKPYWRTPKFRNGAWYVRDSYGWRELTAVVRNGKTIHLEAETF